MSAAIIRLDTYPAAMATEPDPAETPAKPRSIHRMNGRAGTWTFPVHADCLLDMVRMASMLRQHCDEPYSFEAAVASYTLDTHNGAAPKGKADYERIWGWSEQQLKTRWNDVTGSAEKWRTAYGRLTNDRATTEQRTGNDKQTDSSAETQSSNDRATTEQRPSNGHTKKLKQEPSDGGDVSAREADELLDPQIRPPTLETVLESTRMRSIPDDIATRVFNEYEGVGWVDWNSRPIRKWPAAVFESCRKIQIKAKSATGTSNGKHQPAHSGKPQTDHGRRRDVANRSFDNEADWIEAFSTSPDPGDGNGSVDSDR